MVQWIVLPLYKQKCLWRKYISITATRRKKNGNVKLLVFVLYSTVLIFLTSAKVQSEKNVHVTGNPLCDYFSLYIILHFHRWQEVGSGHEIRLENWNIFIIRMQLTKSISFPFSGKWAPFNLSIVKKLQTTVVYLK